MDDDDRLLQKSSRQFLGCFVHGASELSMRRHPMYGTRPARPAPGHCVGKRSDKGPCRARTSAGPKRDQSIPVVVLLASTSRLAAVVGWTGKADGKTTMNSAIWRHHWLQRKPTTTTAIYQLTDRLHDGHMARVPVDEITATVSEWLADVGAHSPLVDDLARAVRIGDWPTAYALGEYLSVDVAVAG